MRLRLTLHQELPAAERRNIQARIEEAFRLHTELANELREPSDEETAIITDGFELYDRYFLP